MINVADQNVRISPVEIQRYLSGVNYPASKEDLIARAQDNDASQGIFDVLNELPDQEYESPAQVSKEIAKAV